MARDAITEAKNFMRYRRFDKAINLLESRIKTYVDDFDYYLTLGTACLYAGDIGAASEYYNRARKTTLPKLSSTQLLLGQAAIFLRRGKTDFAINYYIEVLDGSPENKTARDALEFIRINHGDFSIICRWIDTGKIEQFYPPLGANPYKIMGCIAPVVACVLGCFIALGVVSYKKQPRSSRADLSALVLTVDEQKNALEGDLSSGAFLYILTTPEVFEAYEKAQKYFQQYRDNLAQVEINRILNSNASVAVKRKARLLMDYFSEPTFDTIRDSPSFKSVEKESALYLDCWVVWSGRISNVTKTDTSYSFNLLVGYESLDTPVIEGIVPVRFSVSPVISPDKPVRVLGKISSDGGKLYLAGRHIYQSVKD